MAARKKKGKDTPDSDSRERYEVKSPDATNIFWFDAGRSYQAGLMIAVSGIKLLTFDEFLIHCRLILVRYLNPLQEEIISELYKAFTEGFDKGDVWLRERSWIGKPAKEVS